MLLLKPGLDCFIYAFDALSSLRANTFREPLARCRSTSSVAMPCFQPARFYMTLGVFFYNDCVTMGSVMNKQTKQTKQTQQNKHNKQTNQTQQNKQTKQTQQNKQTNKQTNNTTCMNYKSKLVCLFLCFCWHDDEKQHIACTTSSNSFVRLFVYLLACLS
jgi:mannitol-specific phosphotransferase system IIBC component